MICCCGFTCARQSSDPLTDPLHTCINVQNCRYDDLNSTKIKVEAAKAAKLGGIGVFTGENVGSNAGMWQALGAIKNHDD